MIKEKVKLIIGTGSRHYISPKAIRIVYQRIITEIGLDFEYYHGNQKGYDQLSDFVLRRFGLPYTRIRKFNAEWNIYGDSAGPIRNQQMINEGLERYNPQDILVIAMPLETSIGTYRCIEYAKSKNLDVLIFNERGDKVGNQ